MNVVLLKVIIALMTFITTNPNIPQDVKDKSFEVIREANVSQYQSESCPINTTTSPIVEVREEKPIVLGSVPTETQECTDMKRNYNERLAMVLNVQEAYDEELGRLSSNRNNYAPEWFPREKGKLDDLFDPKFMNVRGNAEIYRGKMDNACK